MTIRISAAAVVGMAEEKRHRPLKSRMGDCGF